MIRDLAKASAVVLLWLGALEGGLRLWRPVLPLFIRMPDPQRSFRYRPGASGWNDNEGRNLMQVNSLGFQDRERTLARPPGDFRIAIIGSSMVEAPQMPRKDAFPGVMESLIKRSGAIRARDVEVLNFGVGGYGLPQMWLLMRDEVWKYDPQIVILAIGLYNDIVDCDRYSSVNDCRFPYFIVQNGQLVPDGETPPSRAPGPRFADWAGRFRDAENDCKLALLVEKAIQSLSPGAQWRPGLQSDPHRIATFSPPSGWHLSNAWAVAEASIRLIRDECDRRHVEFWVVTLDDERQSEPDPLLVEEWRREWNIADVHYPDRRIIQFAAREGIRNFWLAPRLSEYAATHRTALRGFFNTRLNYGHYNALGHQVVARYLADELCHYSDRLRAGSD